MSDESDGLLAATAPVTRRVRAFFAPVDRVSMVPTVFDPVGMAGFDVENPPAPWVDLGWCTGFARRSGTKVEALTAGAPGVAVGQVRSAVEALVTVEFASWGKLQMALTAGVQQMNVLAAAAGAQANGSGGAAAAATALGAGSTASTLAVAGFAVGDVVAVDVDYAGATGFVGSGVSGGYVKNAALIAGDVDYVRRVSLNVGRVVAVNDGVAVLGAALLAGVPAAAMKVSKVVGFCDREGGSFFQEWSALFVADGEQGDRVVYHYPRLQAAAGAAEMYEALAVPLERVRLAGSFRALPVKDANDGESVVCFRSYLPGAMRAV